MNPIEVPQVDKPFVLSQGALESGVTQFIGLIQGGRLAHWLVAVDRYVDISGWGKRKQTTTLFDIHLAPTREADAKETIELSQSDAVRDSLEEVVEFLSKYEIRWLNGSEAQVAIRSMNSVDWLDR